MSHTQMTQTPPNASNASHQPTRISVFIVDDHPMIRAGLVGMIQGESDFLCVGEAGHGADAVRMIPVL